MSMNIIGGVYLIVIIDKDRFDMPHLVDHIETGAYPHDHHRLG